MNPISERTQTTSKDEQRKHFCERMDELDKNWTFSLSDRDFDSPFTTDKPIIFNFHGYPWLIHKLAYRRTNHGNLHVRGSKEQGNIDTPHELAICNQVDRFNLAIDVIDRVAKLSVAGAHVKEWLKDQIIENTNYAFEQGIDNPEFTDWQWPEQTGAQ